MSLRTSRLPTRLGRTAPEEPAGPDNRLSYMDQATFLTLRATGREQLMQIVWIYEHPIDMDIELESFLSAYIPSQQV